MRASNLAVSAAALLALLSGCDPQANLVAVQTASVAVLERGEARLLLEDEGEQLQLAQALLSNTNPGFEIRSLKAPAAIERIAGQYFLVSRGESAEGECITTAILLEASDSGILGALSKDGSLERTQGHTCSGVQCSGCNLHYDSAADGWWCDCWKPASGPGDSYCNHSCNGDC